MMFKYKSKVGVANPKSNSLRNGLPKQVAQFLGVEAGDTLTWIVEVKDSDNVIIRVEKSN